MMQDLPSRLLRPLNDAEQYVSFFFSNLLIIFRTFFFFLDICEIHKLVEEG
jgi:hypothetical protein